MRFWRFRFSAKHYSSIWFDVFISARSLVFGTHPDMSIFWNSSRLIPVDKIPLLTISCNSCLCLVDIPSLQFILFMRILLNQEINLLPGLSECLKLLTSIFTHTETASLVVCWFGFGFCRWVGEVQKQVLLARIGCDVNLSILMFSRELFWKYLFQWVYVHSTSVRWKKTETLFLWAMFLIRHYFNREGNI